MLRNTNHHVSLHSAAPSAAVALCSAFPLPAVDEGVPEWVHLLPAGEIMTGDGRGPYRVKDAQAVIAASLQAMAGAGVIDENHATDLAAPRGEAAPARGWIKELQAREDGIWGRVEWTAAGERLVKGRAYRGISPAIHHRRDGTVEAILRASLVNLPNLRGLATLHQEETSMDFMEKLRKALGLADDAAEASILEAVNASRTELQSALDPIATKLGLQAGADQAAVLAGVEQLATRADADSDDIITGLQSEVVTLATELKALKEGGAKTAAQNFVDAAIKAGRVGVKPMRDRYVSMHMEKPAETEELINALPTLGAGNVVVPATPPANDGEISLNAEQRSVAKMLGLDPKDYAETLKAERAANEEAI